MIFYFYDGDDAISKDYELKRWAKELYEDGYGGGDKFPSEIKTREELAKILATVIFTSTAQHSVLNFAQYETFGFAPNNPGALYSAPPGSEGTKVVKGSLTEKDIFKMLPPKKNAMLQVAESYVLSQYSRDEDYLGQFNARYFRADSQVQKIRNTFSERLTVIENLINERGQFLHLVPSKIPNSTAI